MRLFAFANTWICGLLVCFLLLWKLASFLRYRHILRRHGCSEIARYPHKDPLLGYDLYRIIERSKQRNDATPTIRRLFNSCSKGKTFQALTWGIPTVYSIDPRIFRAVLKEDVHSFGVEPFRKAFYSPWISRGLLVSDGQEWTKSRAILGPLFQKSQYADIPGLEVHLKRLLALIPRDGGTFDIQPLFCRLGMDLASEYLFGQSFESLLSKPRIDVARFSAAVEKSLKGVQRRVVLSSLLRLLPKDHIWHRAYSEVNELFDRYIDLAIEEQKSPPKTGEPLPDASATDRPFIMLRELLKETQNRHFLRNQLTTVFLPMYQAAPFGLGDIFFQLARAPGTWAKLRAEALEMGDTQLTFEVLKSMTYLQCVIKESFRLLAPLDRIVRVCVRDCVLPCGGGASGEEPSLVQQGTLVDLRSNIMHRDIDFWGADAEEFRPERWLDPGLRPKWEYLPFGGGARNCPAQRMTQTQCAFVVARLAQEFEALENRDPVVEFVDEYNFSKRSRNGVKVAILPATAL